MSVELCPGNIATGGQILESIRICGVSRRCAFGFVSVVAPRASRLVRTGRGRRNVVLCYESCNQISLRRRNQGVNGELYRE